MEIISLRLKMENVFGVEFESNSECRLFLCVWNVIELSSGDEHTTVLPGKPRMG